MVIEKIVCPILNGFDEAASGIEVFVRFDNLEQPSNIICDDYNPDKRCCDNFKHKGKGKKCIYTEWQPFSEKKE
jgi:hypothetical protein